MTLVLSLILIYLPVFRTNRSRTQFKMERTGIIYQRLEMLINGWNFLTDRKQSISSCDKRAVISNSDLLHLPLNPLRIHSKQLRLLQNSLTDIRFRKIHARRDVKREIERERNLVETIKSEREELGDVRLLSGGSEREKTCRRFRRRHLPNLRCHFGIFLLKPMLSKSPQWKYTDPEHSRFFIKLTWEMFLWFVFLLLDLKFLFQFSFISLIKD